MCTPLSAHSLGPQWLSPESQAQLENMGPVVGVIVKPEAQAGLAYHGGQRNCRNPSRNPNCHRRPPFLTAELQSSTSAT